MSMFRRLAVACGAVLVASGVVAAPFLTGLAAAAELIADGGFENATGNPLNSPSWTEADSDRTSPLCSTSLCPTSASVSPPRTGDKWIVFGARNSSTQTASMSQAVTIPSGGTASLTYWYRSAEVSSPFTATVTVKVDGTTLKTHTETSTPESAYSQQTVNLSAYTNGASHTISFNYSASNSSSSQRLVIDDVSLTYTTAVTGTPTVTSTTPASPSSNTKPLVKGTAETGSTVTLYSNSSCTSAALGTGSAATFASTGITATVPANATTTIWAKATKSGQTASACSSTSVPYTNDSTAPGLVAVSSVTPASPGSSTTPVIKGTAEAGSTVKLYPTSTCTGTPSATGTAAAFAATGLTVTVAPGSTTTFRATATDAAGNTSACSTTSVTYVNDSTAPAQPTLTGVTPTSPGTSTTPAVKGTAEASSTVKLYTSADCSGSPAATGTAAAFASPGLTVTVAPGSTTTFKATAADAAGNTSACSSSSLTYVNDSAPPGLVALTGVNPTSPGKSTTPAVTGTAEAGSTVRLYTTSDCSGSPAATGTAAALASPGLTVTVVANSTTTFRAKATDAAGNASACSTSSVTYVNDSVVPAPVVLDSVTPASPSTSTTPVLAGTAEAGSTVRLYATPGCTGSPAATGTAAAFASPGLTATVVLGSQTTFRATATDPAGNTSACSTSSVTYLSDLRDGGFEASTGNPADSPDWVEADSLAGSPLCTVATCTPGDEIAPHSGNAWVWFGGFGDAGHTGSLAQAVALPAGPLALTFWYRNSTVSFPYDAQLRVQVDGTTVRTITEATQADDTYTLQVVDLSAYANGVHVLSFNYTNGQEGVNNMLVDDVSLRATTGPRTATPTVTSTLPASPSTSATPRVTGTAEDGSTVTLYANGICAGAALGSGSAAELGAGGISATVPAGTTTIFAKAAKAGQDDSACSTTFASYTQLGPPETGFVKTPKKTVRTHKRKASVVFAFGSATGGATFECSLDGKAFAACTSGAKLKLRPGKHTFAVRALAFGLADPTPATFDLKVKRRR